MKQLILEKQGSFNSANWHSRVVTFDVATKSVFISQCGSPLRVCRRKLVVRDVEVESLPFHGNLSEWLAQWHALLIVRIRGTEISPTEEEMRAVEDVTGSSHSRMPPIRNPLTGRMPSPPIISPVGSRENTTTKPLRAQSWALRSASPAVVLQLLHYADQMRCSRCSIRVPPPQGAVDLDEYDSSTAEIGLVTSP